MTEKHHYVPETYLKRFVNADKKLYRLLKVERKARPHIKHCSPGGTGYSHGLNTINDESQLRKYGIDNPNFIEDFFAQHHDNHCNRLLDVFLQPEILLPVDSARTLMLFVLSFKQRNPALRSDYADVNFVKYIFNNRLHELEAKLRVDNVPPEQLGNKSIDELIGSLKKAAHALTESPDFAANVHTGGILETLTGQRTVVDEAADILLSFEWRVLVTEPTLPFVTSDNPAFTIDSTEQYHNLNLNEAQCFCFPLSPQHCLVLVRPSGELLPALPYKKIEYIAPDDPLFIRAINRGTHLTSYKFIYGNDKAALEQTWQDVQLG